MIAGNPIIQRELVGLMRSGRMIAAQALFALALALLVVLRWPTDVGGSAGKQVMAVFCYGMTAALILLAPVFPATSIVREKRSGTLALLLNSPLAGWPILVGKLAAVVGYALVLLLLSLPAAAACFAAGGPGLFTTVGQAYLVLFCLAFQYGTLGLLVSSFAQTTDGAARVTYGLVLLLAVVAMGPYQFLQGNVYIPAVLLTAVEWLRCVSPIPAMMEVVGHSAVGSQGLGPAEGVALRFCLLALLSGAAFAVWTALRLGQRILDRSRAAGKITDEQSTTVQAYRRFMYLWFFDPQRRSNLIGPLTNPVMVKEFRSRRFGRGHWMMRLIGGCVIVSLGLMLAATRGTIDWGVETLGGILVILQAALIILLTPSLASGLISAERESGGWQLLQMTPLSTITIVTGKLMSVAWTLALILLSTLPAYAVLLAIKWEMWPTVVNVLGVMVLTAVFAVLVSAACSAVFRRTAGATTAAYAILVGLCAGTMLFWMGQDAPFSHATVEQVLRWNPLAAALHLIKTPGFVDYRLLPYTWWIIGSLSAAALVVLVVQTWRLTRPR